MVLHFNMFLLLSFMLIAGNFVHAKHVIYYKPTADLQPYSDAKLKEMASVSPLFATILKLTQQLQDLSLNQNDTNRKVAAHIKRIEIFIPPFTLPPNVSKLIGTRLPGPFSAGPVSSASSVTGLWTWRNLEGFFQGNIDIEWFQIRRAIGIVPSPSPYFSFRSDGVWSDPIILPFSPYVIGSFGFKAHFQNEMQIGFYCFDIKHNQNLSSNLQFTFEVKIKIQDNGFTEIKNCSFKVVGIHVVIYSPNLMPINKNWSKDKFPKDIVFSFL